MRDVDAISCLKTGKMNKDVQIADVRRKFHFFGMNLSYILILNGNQNLNFACRNVPKYVAIQYVELFSIQQCEK